MLPTDMGNEVTDESIGLYTLPFNLSSRLQTPITSHSKYSKHGTCSSRSVLLVVILLALSHPEHVHIITKLFLCKHLKNMDTIHGLQGER